MTAYAKDLWKRAEKSLASARILIKISPDDAASRAYYAVFHAVSAAFALRNKTFVKHSAVREARQCADRVLNRLVSQLPDVFTEK